MSSSEEVLELGDGDRRLESKALLADLVLVPTGGADGTRSFEGPGSAEEATSDGETYGETRSTNARFEDVNDEQCRDSLWNSSGSLLQTSAA